MHAAAPASADEAAAGDSCKAAAFASGGAAALRALSRSASHAAGSPAVRSYVRALGSRWGAYAVFAFWLALSCVGLSSYKKVFPALNTKFEPIPGSNLGEAMAALSASFPGNSTIDSYALVWSDGAGALPAGAVANLTAALTAFCAPYTADGTLVAGPTSSSSLEAAGWTARAAQMTTADGRSSFVRLTTVGQAQTKRLIHQLLLALPDMAPADCSVGLTGLAVMSVEEGDAVESDAVRSDSATVPTSLLILAFVLRSPRFLIITVCALGVTLLVTFAFILALARAVPVPTFTVSLVVSTTVAVSLDYSLFLLSFLRARMGRQENSAAAAAAMPESVGAMLQSTGHTIVVSGATLASCFLVLGIFPLSLLRYPGICTAGAVALAMAVNLSLVPALLLRFPRFWSYAVHSDVTYRPLHPALRRARDAAQQRAASLAKWAGVEEEEEGADGEVAEDDDGYATGALWRTVAAGTQRRRRSLLAALLLLLVVPFAPHLHSFSVSIQWEGTMPHGARSLALYRRFGAEFGVAATTPPSVLLGLARNASVSVLSAPLFAATAAAAQAAAAARPDTVVSSLPWSGGGGVGGGTNVTLEQVSAALALGCPAGLDCTQSCPEAACTVLSSLVGVVSKSQSAALVVLHPAVDTFTAEGYQWGLALRRVAEQLDGADETMRWFYIGDSGILIADLSAYTYAFLPKLVAATAGIVIVIVGLAFNSFVIPIRTVLSIMLMLVCVYGAAAAIFQVGVLNGTHSAIFTNADGLEWLMPVLCFIITVGLGLDYDIFLLGRIVRERETGWDDTSAIIRGVERSGPVISWAGVIMAVAFGGLLSARTPLLNQLSFFIVFGVLVDTFIIRTFLVPAAHGLLGAWVWWPCGHLLPPPTRSLPLARRLKSTRIAPLENEEATRRTSLQQAWAGPPDNA